MGVEPEDLGVSTTSRTYANAVDRRIDRINDLLSAFMLAISQRLSMGDVTRRGNRVEHDLNAYMRSNPTERWNTYSVAHAIGALTVDEIRARETLPPLSTQDETPAEPAVPAAVAAAGNVVALRMADAQLQFVDLPVYGFTVDSGSRTIEGIAVPYGKVGNKMGLGFRFERGSIQFGDVSRVKLLRDHDFTRAIGYATDIKDTPQGLKVKFQLGRGPLADEALQGAEDRILDGFSIGVDFDMSADTVPDQKNRGGVLVRRADLKEVSLLAMPAFDDARVTRVAASLDGGTSMETCTACGHQHAAGAPCVQPVAAPALVGAGVQFNQGGQAQPPAVPPAPGAPAQQPGQLFQLPAGMNLAQLQGLQGLAALMGGQVPAQPAAQPPAEPAPTVVNPTRLQAGTEVTEPPSYWIDRGGNLRPGKWDFSQDLFRAFGGDVAAHDRAIEFVRAQFDVNTGNVDELNPTRQRPDMYVDQKDFTYPVWDSIDKGTLTDITPFTFPKFNSAAGLVGAHTEGVEPSSGTFTTTSQTVTPTANSGKAKITRETWDQGGNPQVSGLIWKQMVKGWYEGLEAAAVALLEAASPTVIDFSGTPGLADDDLDQAITAAFAALQFIRGGFRMNTGFTQIDLYKALVAAKDGQGRRLYPAIGPTNAMGTVRSRFAALDVNGVLMLPAWALAASGTVSANSYLFDNADVHGWASTPQRLEFNIEVAHVYLGIWGYKATAISDITGVRRISYDPQ
jgi:HK97 family phage prohead protease